VAAGRAPNLKIEREMLAAGSFAVAGCDEVGRGSLGGPVSVGMVVVDAATRRPPTGLRDSKLLAPAARESLVPRIRSWSCCWAIGHASAAEIDEIGILRALRLAGERALADLAIRPDLVLLDGNYDWFTRPARSAASPAAIEPDRVSLKVKADLTCASVAAASVIAKVARDRHMVELARSYPSYGWHSNKGYAAPEHRAGLLEIGPCEEHRRSWHLLVSEQPTLFDEAELEADAGSGADCLEGGYVESIGPRAEGRKPRLRRAGSPR
jgi:ribonuclease HII